MPVVAHFSKTHTFFKKFFPKDFARREFFQKKNYQIINGTIIRILLGLSRGYRHERKQDHIVDLPSPTSNTEPVTKGYADTGQRYFNHDVTKEMLQNNVDFYNDVCNKRFDIRLFEQSFKKRKWCPMQVIGFIALGRVLSGEDVIGLLAKWVPNYRAQFWWFVIYKKLMGCISSKRQSAKETTP